MDLAFHNSHPPLIAALDDDIPDRSDYGIVGTLEVRGDDMNRVVDPAYPWRQFLGAADPAHQREMRRILAARDEEVDHYLVTRRQYWQMRQRWHYGTETQVNVTRHTGYVEHRSHVAERSHSVVERIAADLSLDLSGSSPVPPEIPPVMPMAVAGEGEGEGGGGREGGGKAGLSFSREMTDTLHITDTDERTYTDETTTTTQVTFERDTTYVHWELIDECVIQRVLRAAPEAPETIAATRGATGFDYTDNFCRSGGDGD